MVKNLQAMRFLFCFSIFVGHLFGQHVPSYGIDEYGVSGFFILSGFLLSFAYGKKIEQAQFRTWKFFYKQWVKIYPLHIATFLLAILYEAYYGSFYEWYRLLLPVFLLQSWIPDDAFHYIPNGSSWALCGFFFFYLTFQGFYVVLNRLTMRSMIGWMVTVLALYVVIAVNAPDNMVYPFVYTSPIMRLFDFVGGIALFRFVSSESGMRIARGLNRCHQGLLTVIELGVLLLPVLSFAAYYHVDLALRCASLFWLFVAVQLAVFYWSDQLNGMITRVMHSKPLLFLGGISFEFYLIHMFIVPSARSVAFSMGFQPVGVVSFTIAFSVSIMLAYSAKRYYVDRIIDYFKPYIRGL